jgi:hypothetical protein
MRPIGPTLILVGSVATIPGMFLPLFEVEAGSLNWWEVFNGLDIALTAACALAALLALAALIGGQRPVRQLAGVAAGVTFGLAFTFVPDTIGSTAENTGAGLWVVAGTGAVALLGAVLIASSASSSE